MSLYIDYRGHRFFEPFHCLCCGIEISARQFAWGRACGYCDIGRCQDVRKGYKEGHGDGWTRLEAAPPIPIITENCKHDWSQTLGVMGEDSVHCCLICDSYWSEPIEGWKE